MTDGSRLAVAGEVSDPAVGVVSRGAAGLVEDAELCAGATG